MYQEEREFFLEGNEFPYVAVKAINLFLKSLLSF